MRKVRILISAAPFLWSIALAQPAPLKVEFAGRLLGYAAIPEQQTEQMGVDSCQSEMPNAVAGTMIGMRSQGADIRVALGDNFAPYVGARQMLRAGGLSEPKELFSWTGTQWKFQQPFVHGQDDTGRGEISFDNVGCFMRRAEFAAVVPGKHDFHFGPERLRELARYLAAPARGSEKPVQMLASNLLIKTSPAKAPDPFAPKPRAPKFPLSARLASGEEMKFVIPSAVLPWIRTFKVGNAVHYGELSQDKIPRGTLKAPGNNADRALLDKGCLIEANQVTTDCSEPLVSLVQEEPSRYGTAAYFRIQDVDVQLEPGKQYRACATSADQTFFCSSPFAVQAPFFQFPDHLRPDGIAERNGRYTPPSAYALVETRDHGHVAVFGVLDPALRSHIGGLNDSWLNWDPSLDTMLQISDPEEALQQTLDACFIQPNCKTARRILLAQMPLAKANALATRFNGQFDLVLAEPDAALAIPDGTISRSVDSRKPFVLAPEEQWQASHPNSLRVTWQNATIADTREGHRSLTLSTSRSDAPIPAGPSADSEQKTLLARLSEKVNLHGEAAPRSKLVEDAALIAMRTHCGADIGMLQHRDLFEPDTLAAVPLKDDQVQNALDRIFWKGDLVICRDVTASAVKDVLDQSDKFDAADQDETSTEREYHRGIAHLGVYQDSDTKSLVISGGAPDPSKLYSLATTDYIALGDTGYASLAQQRRLATYETRVMPLSTLLCRRIVDQRFCHEPIRTGAGYHYFDVLDISTKGTVPAGPQSETRALVTSTAPNLDSLDPPEPAGAAVVPPHHETAFIQGFPSWWRQNTRRAGRPPSPTEGEAQNRPFWTLTLQKSDIGVNSVLHSLSETDRANNFTGINLAQVNAKQEYDFTFDYSYRITRWARTFDRYVQGDASYSDTHIATPAKPRDGISPDVLAEKTDFYVINVKTNQLSQEFGLAWHLYPWRQQSQTGLRLNSAIRMESQVRDPVQQFQLKNAEGIYGYDRERQIPRSYYVFTKLGLRYQGPKNWFESGIEGGERFNRPVEYQWINSTGTKDFSCDLAAPVTASTGACSSTLAAPGVSFRPDSFRVSTVNHPQYGWFLNFQVFSPKIAGVTYSATNQGEYFFQLRGDSRIDTRYFDDLTLAASVPIFGGFSLSPKVDLFVFRSKFDQAYNTGGWHLHGFQTSVTLQYCFEHRSGVPWKASFGTDICGNSKKK